MPPKVLGTFNHPLALVNELLSESHKLSKQDKYRVLFDTKQYPTHHLKLSSETVKAAADFASLQLFKTVFTKKPTKEKDARHHMLKKCRLYYRNNTSILRKIDEFAETYEPDKAIDWYAKGTFVYSLVNKALRTNNIETLYAFRFYISDLRRSLTALHRRQSDVKGVINLYRGVQMSYSELKTYESGMLIAENSFLSTTRNRAVAEMFAGSGCSLETPETVSVLYNISFDRSESVRKHSNTALIFADVSHLSDKPDEEEVLFDLSTMFIIDAITFDENPDCRTWIIKMRPTNEGEQLIHKLLFEHHDQTIEIFQKRYLEWAIKSYKDLLLSTFHLDFNNRNQINNIQENWRNFMNMPSMHAAFDMVPHVRPHIGSFINMWATINIMQVEVNRSIRQASFLYDQSLKAKVKRTAVTMTRRTRNWLFPTSVVRGEGNLNPGSRQWTLAKSGSLVGALMNPQFYQLPD